jgi:hypothetical protein
MITYQNSRTHHPQPKFQLQSCLRYNQISSKCKQLHIPYSPTQCIQPRVAPGSSERCGWGRTPPRRRGAGGNARRGPRDRAARRGESRSWRQCWARSATIGRGWGRPRLLIHASGIGEEGGSSVGGIDIALGEGGGRWGHRRRTGVRVRAWTHGFVAPPRAWGGRARHRRRAPVPHRRGSRGS